MGVEVRAVEVGVQVQGVVGLVVGYYMWPRCLVGTYPCVHHIDVSCNRRFVRVDVYAKPVQFSLCDRRKDARCSAVQCDNIIQNVHPRQLHNQTEQQMQWCLALGCSCDGSLPRATAMCQMLLLQCGVVITREYFRTYRHILPEVGIWYRSNGPCSLRLSRHCRELRRPSIAMASSI